MKTKNSRQKTNNESDLIQLIPQWPNYCDPHLRRLRPNATSQHTLRILSEGDLIVNIWPLSMNHFVGSIDEVDILIDTFYILMNSEIDPDSHDQILDTFIARLWPSLQGNARTLQSIREMFIPRLVVDIQFSPGLNPKLGDFRVITHRFMHAGHSTESDNFGQINSWRSWCDSILPIPIGCPS